VTRTVCILIYAGGQSLDISGPLEVFALADRQAREDGTATAPLYRLRMVASEAVPVTLASGIRVLPDLTCEQMDPAATDTLLISGGMGDALDRARENRTLVEWIGRCGSRVRRIASICSGALLLAEAGLLDGREATTHWRDVAELERRYRKVRVIPDAIYTRDGNVWTSAGITAGMDLALAMVADDHGMPLALKVAKRMVMVSKRSGGQSQFSSQLEDLDVPDAFARLTEWMRANLTARLSVEHLAEQACMSRRHFGRRFQQVFGSTPQKYVERLRVEAAKSLLENSTRDIKRIASDCGFASDGAMRHAFVRQLGILPRDYRERFGLA
jgi:transcriptional regulator GlxA family with amidase domain